MENTTFVGIDISKDTLDMCITTPDGKATFTTIANNTEAIRAFLAAEHLRGAVVAMENTGRYNWALFQVLPQTTCLVYVLCPIALKKSIGLSRGKNDRIDSARICDYVRTHRRKLSPWKPAAKDLCELKALLALRSRRVKAIAATKTAADDYRELGGLDCAGDVKSLDEAMITMLKEQVKAIEVKIEALVTASLSLGPVYALMRSVPGAGKILCWTLLVKTCGFSILTDARKMACYAGVVPFEHRSGTSVKGRNKVSQYADKGLKRLLHLGAMSAIRLAGELRNYYLRKVAEGKSKMSTLNAVRAKILHRIYAAVRNNQPYKPYNLTPLLPTS